MAESNVTSQINLYDHEILKIEQGPLAWMQDRQWTQMDLEGFRKAVVEQFAEIGLDVRVNCWETDQPKVYAFDVVIQKRNDRAAPWDPDRMVHEVTRNILEIPGQEPGFIKTDKAMRDTQARHRH